MILVIFTNDIYAQMWTFVVLLTTKSLYYRLSNTFDFKGAFKNTTPTRQGGYQAAGLCVAICFGVGGGILVGKEYFFHQTFFTVDRANQNILYATTKAQY